MSRKILIMGLPGAGKTTLANALAPLLNAVVFKAPKNSTSGRIVVAVSLTAQRLMIPAPWSVDCRRRAVDRPTSCQSGS
jgi:predicted ATPase